MSPFAKFNPKILKTGSPHKSWAISTFAAVALLAATVGTVPAFAQNASVVGGTAVQVHTTHEMVQQALEAMRKGDFLKGSDLLEKASASQGAQAGGGNTELYRLARWAEQFKGQREVLIEERRKAYNKTVGDVQKLIKANLDEAAIDHARAAYVLAEDKVEYTQQPWVRALIDRTAALAAEQEEKQQWLRAQRLYGDLASIEQFNKTWKEKFSASARRTRMLTLYSPGRIRELLAQDVTLVDRVRDVLNEERQAPATKPTTQPFEQALQINWRDELKGIKPEMLWIALLNVRSYYWKEPDFAKLMTGGFEGVRSLVTTEGVDDAFPSLADAAKKQEFLARLDELEERMKGARKGSEIQTAGQIFPRLFELNRQTIGLPDEVIVFEFADASLATLDQFSQMLWPAQWEDFNKRTQGEFSGVGIQIQNDDEGNIKVISPIEDSPAFKAGVKAGDLITAVDGKSLKGVTTTAAVRIITGAIGTPVTLTIANADGTGARDLRLVRDTIHVASLKGFMYKPGGGWDYFIDSDQRIAYLRLTDFYENFWEELNKVAEELKRQGAKGLIFDLRGNGGGLLSTAIDVANKFLPAGTIVSTKADRQTPQPPQLAVARPEPDEITIPTVVLVNQSSASASEIVAGALKDLGRATIVGERTYGKGSVQMPFDVTNGRQAGFLKLTISHYYLPSGVCLHREEDSTTWGVEPDVKVEMTPEQQMIAMLARMQFDVLRQTGEMPPEPTSRPTGAASRPVIRGPEDLIARDSQLGAALLMMRMKLNGAEIAGTAHAARTGNPSPSGTP